jgi:hypothetical protein
LVAPLAENLDPNLVILNPQQRNDFETTGLSSSTSTASSSSSAGSIPETSPPVVLFGTSKIYKRPESISEPMQEQDGNKYGQSSNDGNQNNPQGTMTPEGSLPSQQLITRRLEALNQMPPLFSFNGVTRCAVFPVSQTVFSITIWSTIMSSSSTNLQINPFHQLALPISELLDLTLPPVDAMCLNPWPKPLNYYRTTTGAILNAQSSSSFDQRSIGLGTQIVKR